MEMNKYYYDIKNDIRDFPDCWAYFIWSGRNTGKTYSTLSYMLETGSRFIFLKRTIEDVKLILSGSGKIGTKVSQYGADFSPFKAINRDKGTRIRAFGLYKGYIGGFWECDDQNQPILDPIGYIVALNAVSKVKGFDLSDCDYLIFDEFIPQNWERVDKEEGKQLLDLYMTVSRDREHRGRPPLKLICLANPTNVNCPIFQELEIADDASYMAIQGHEYYQTRGMLLHNIRMGNDFRDKEESMPALLALQGTRWHDAALGEGFAYQDMTMIRKINLKGYRCMIKILYRKYEWYIYQNGPLWYCCTSKGDPLDGAYDLNTDADVRRFFQNWQIELKQTFSEGLLYFKTYTMYDVIINFRKFFKNI